MGRKENEVPDESLAATRDLPHPPDLLSLPLLALSNKVGTLLSLRRGNAHGCVMIILDPFEMLEKIKIFHDFA